MQFAASYRHEQTTVPFLFDDVLTFPKMQELTLHHLGGTRVNSGLDAASHSGGRKLCEILSNVVDRQTISGDPPRERHGSFFRFRLAL
jgi:hypothetical protein